MVSTIEESKSFMEILEYLSLVLPEQSQDIQKIQMLDEFARKWDQVYVQEYKKLLETPEESINCIDEEGKKLSCASMAMLNVFNAISDEFVD